MEKGVDDAVVAVVVTVDDADGVAGVAAFAATENPPPNVPNPAAPDPKPLDVVLGFSDKLRKPTRNQYIRAERKREREENRCILIE